MGVLAAPIASADVIFMGQANVQPAGIGTVPTLLNLQSQGSATDARGLVRWNGSTSVTEELPNLAGAAQPGVETTNITGGNNNQARLFSEIGVTSASDLRVFFNINEPSPTDSVVLSSLIFNVYDASGTVVFSGGLAAPRTLIETGAGIGTSDYVFGLNEAQAMELQGIFSPTLRLGIEASVSSAQGGFETFWAGRAGMVPPPDEGGEVSEPGTLALMGLTLAGFALVRRQRRRQ